MPPTPAFASALALFQQGDLARCEAVLRRALPRDRENPDLLALLAMALWPQRKADQAEHFFRAALAIDPDHPQSLGNLGRLLTERGRAAEAVPLLQRVAEKHPARPEGWVNLAGALVSLRRYDEAAHAAEKAVRAGDAGPGTKAGQAAPVLSQAYSTWAGALVLGGRVDEAIAALRSGLASVPDAVVLASPLAATLNYSDSLDPAAIFEEHRRLGALIASRAPASPFSPPVGGPGPISPGRRFRVGYISADLRNHAVAAFIAPVLRHHRRDRVEVFAYQTAPADAVSARLSTLADHWCEGPGWSDSQWLAKLRADGLDALVELNGHTVGQRLGVLAARAAPLQVTYLGYPNTSAIPTIDLRLVDAHTDPPGAEALATERLVRLPRCFLAFEPPADAPEVSQRPPGAPLNFGSANSHFKIGPRALALWARLVLAVPGSRLLLKSQSLSDEAVRARALGLLTGAGLAPDRVELRGHTPGHAQHLRVYHDIDIALDALPYHGTTTTCEALWMGVPVLTIAGRSHVSRVGVSLLKAVGLEELIAPDEEGFIQRGVRLANDAARRADWRSSLRSTMAASPLCDGAGLARAIEAALGVVD